MSYTRFYTGPQTGKRSRQLAIVSVAAALVACTPRNAPPALDQSTPQAGLLAFYDALATGDPAAVRRCLYAKPNHERFAHDMAELFAADAHFHHVINGHFPGQDKGLFWDWFTDANLQEARRVLPRSQVILQGNHATFKFPDDTTGTMAGPVNSPLYQDGGHWKIDLEASANSENYPPKIGKDDVTMGMTYLLHEACPILLSVAADVESGKFKTIAEVKKAMDDASQGNEERSSAKLALEPVNRGNPATRPK